MKRKWTWGCWLFLRGIFLSSGPLPDGVGLLELAVPGACAAGMITGILKLRCSCCGKDAPRAPAFSPASGKVRCCSGCGRPFVYDDGV
ncbi:hypothetical protein AALC17_06715 [Oscillospiraceae bacterium 38-13]